MPPVTMQKIVTDYIEEVEMDSEDLITITEAATLANVTTQAISTRISRGSLTGYIDPESPGKHQGHRCVLRAQVLSVYGLDERGEG